MDVFFLTLKRTCFPVFFPSDNNTFEGEVPIAYITGLPSIKEIDMSENAFSGFDQDTLDEEEDLPKLERLNLGM